MDLEPGTTRCAVGGGANVESSDTGAPRERSAQRRVLTAGIGHSADRLGEQRFEASGVLREQAGHQILERLTMPRAKLWRRQASAVVVALHGTPCAQLKNSDISFGRAEEPRR